jgi:hypothetical protein
VSLVSTDQPAGPAPEPEPGAEPDRDQEPVPTEAEVADELAAAEAADTAESADGDEAEDERRYPSTIGGAFYILVLAVSAVGIGIVWYGDWRLGVRFLAGSLCAAGALRVVLRQRDAGMLAVRNRFLDATVLVGIGAALFFLTATIPDQPV